MGKKLDALLRRGFKPDKFKATVAVAVSRLAVLKSQRQARCSIARSDVVEFLKINNHERALMRVEQVIKEQNMLDVFVLVEGYCHLLLERVNLIEQEKICPEELHEAVSSLIYAATRCGEFPELQEIRAIFTARFGREFAARAVELRNNCGVNPKVIQKLSTRMPSFENKMKMLKEIASDNNIDLPIENTVSDATMEYKESGQEEKQMPGQPCPLGPSGFSHQEENITMHPDEIDTSVRRKYKDVADAAQAAFESAAYAAAAARAAVELSRSESTDPDGSPHTPGGKTELQTHETRLEKIHPGRNYDSEANEDAIIITRAKRSVSDSSLDSFDDNYVKGVEVATDKDDEIERREIVFDDESDDGEEDSKRVHENYPSQFAAKNKMNKITQPLNINRRPISVRTTRTH